MKGELNIMTLAPIVLLLIALFKIDDDKHHTFRTVVMLYLYLLGAIVAFMGLMYFLAWVGR